MEKEKTFYTQIKWVLLLTQEDIISFSTIDAAILYAKMRYDIIGFVYHLDFTQLISNINTKGERCLILL